MGIVERIEYDPNHSSWIALVRWIERVLCSRKRFALSKANSQRKENAWPFLGRREKNLLFFGLLFSFSSLPDKAQRKKYVFFSALYSLKAKKKAATLGPFGSFLTLPKIALARAKPAFFVLQSKDFRGDNTFSQSESQRWKTYSIFWAIMSFYDYPVKIQRNSIQLLMAMSLLRLLPEIQNHFEIFEHIRGFDVAIVTSANTQDETFILWSGFLQKEV
jgi:hypothetical protein